MRSAWAPRDLYTTNMYSISIFSLFTKVHTIYAAMSVFPFIWVDHMFNRLNRDSCSLTLLDFNLVNMSNMAAAEKDSLAMSEYLCKIC